MVSSIFISAQPDELNELRRAAFDAIVDHGSIPEIVESGRGLGDALGAMRERRAIDDTLAGCDKLIGIYHQSLGPPRPALAGLSVLEYQFLRFMIQRRLQQSDDFRSGRAEIAEELDMIMPDTEAAAGPATHALRNEMRVIEEQLALLASLPSDHRRLREKALPALEVIDRDSFYEGRPYHEIFEEDVLLCRYEMADAQPTGKTLAGFLESKPVQTVGGRDIDGPAPGPMPLTAESRLYDICCEWLTDSATAIDFEFETDRTHVISTRFLSLGEILEYYQHCGLTVAEIHAGEAVAVITSQKPISKGRDLGLGGHYERLETALDGHLLAHEPDHIGPTAAADFLIELRIANIPGMLGRIWGVLDRMDIRINSLEQSDQGAESRRALHTIRVACGERPADPEAARRRLAQHLRSVVGVQSCSVLHPAADQKHDRSGGVIHLGECLVDLGILSMRDVWDVLDRRMEDELFGDAAQRLKPIGPEQIEAGLKLQRRMAS